MSESYGVKVLYRYRVEEESFYEEQIIRVEADDFDQAYDKAREYAEAYSEEYTNPKGQKVVTDAIWLLDCYLMTEEEMYSRIFKNPFGSDEESLLNFLDCACSPEEMYPLRNAEFNVSPNI